MKRRLKFFGMFVAMLVVSYFIFYTFTPPFSVSNEKATQLPPKVFPIGKNQDSLMVYVPYKITIRNNRLSPLHFKRIDDENFKLTNSDLANLVFNNDKINLNLPIDDRHQGFIDRYKVKNRNLIFPLLSKVIYYYKGTPVPKNYSTKDIQLLTQQIQNLDINLPSLVDQKTIDSIYKTDDGKRFNVVLMNIRN